LFSSVLQLLCQYDGVITEKQLRQALNIRSGNDLEGLNALLTFDNRFTSCSSDSWRCTPIARIIDDRPIREVSFVVTDIETTGSIRGKDRIIELAAVKVRDGKHLATFESLVDPEKRISRQITRLTHINNQTVEGAPVIDTVLPDFARFACGSIFVGHNAVFDFSFIQSELRRLGLDPLSPAVEICTYRLARKLLPNVKARGISGLSEYYHYPLENRHRAMPDVMATAFFLQRFLNQLTDMGMTTIHQLIDYQRLKLNKQELIKKIRRLRKKWLRRSIEESEDSTQAPGAATILNQNNRCQRP
jgi:DNA polymerase III epsilon subunit family exonuclease